MQIIKTVDWSPNGTAVRIVDQRLLPGTFAERDLTTLDEVCDAIRTLAAASTEERASIGRRLRARVEEGHSVQSWARGILTAAGLDT